MSTKKNKSIHQALRLIPYGLYAVGVCDDQNETNAFVGSWITQCSFDPPLILIAVNQASISHEMLRKGKAFSVNLLDRGRDDLARLLVKPADRAGDKLGKVSFYQNVTGAPILRDAIAFLECKVLTLANPGDHSIAVGEVVDAGLNQEGKVMTCADIGWHYAG